MIYVICLIVVSLWLIVCGRLFVDCFFVDDRLVDRLGVIVGGCQI